ncbi:MAG: hypothetical protein ACM3XO_00705 [Bacteroidota bacterium]
MKILKLGLRLWITVASMLSFLVGWIMLGHAPKPAQNNQASGSDVSPLPTLEPLPPLSVDNGNTNAFQNQPLFNDQSVFNNQPRSFRSRPFFSTGGS